MPKNKFLNFKDCLTRESGESFYISLSDIEKIIDQPLCKSAYKYNAYWSPTVTHTFAVMIKECGYKVEPDLSNKRIRLFKYKFERRSICF